MAEEFDYVVVGGGSAGCVVAGRLSKDPAVTVCLLEAGGPDRSALIHAPAGMEIMMSTQYANYSYVTVPQPGFNNRVSHQGRGKVLGGSSSINAMLYVRGNAWDYDEWARMGNPGWSYAEVLPFFKKAERNEQFDDDFHGTDGPLNVTYPDWESPVSRAFVEAAQLHQLAHNPDYNGARQDGAFLYQATQKNGERCSAAKAYLTPHRGRQNLAIETGAFSERIVLDGKRATEVVFRQNGALRRVKTHREIVLSAGAFNSPHLLMLSGIGDPAEIMRHGIAVRHALPGVGRNLQDHVDYVQAWRTRSPVGTFGISARGLFDVARGVGQWRRERKGLVTSTFASAGAFMRADPAAPAPDLQLIFVLALLDDNGRKAHLGHGFSCHVCVTRPHSRGTVTLASADPQAMPVIDPAFLTDERDLPILLQGGQMMQRIMESAPFDRIRGDMLYPVAPGDSTAMEADIRARGDSQWHPVGTCKMGAFEDRMAVVDHQLRVHGLDGLRVADASIMPRITTGNPNAPAIMIGEKAAAMIAS
jgi:choline dehydrogenase-like flavoprotein